MRKVTPLFMVSRLSSKGCVIFEFFSRRNLPGYRRYLKLVSKAKLKGEFIGGKVHLFILFRSRLKAKQERNI